MQTELAGRIGRRVTYHTGLNILGHALPLLTAVISAPFIIRGLGTEVFGLLSLVWIVLVYSSLFDLGIGKAVTKLVAEEKRISEVFWSSFWIQVSLGWVVASLVLVLSAELVGLLNIPEHLRTEALSVFRIVGWTIPAIMGTAVLRSTLEGREYFGSVNVLKGIGNTGVFLVPLMGVVADWSLTSIVLGMAGLKTLVASIYLILCWIKIPEIRQVGKVSFSTIKTILTFGGWVTVYHLCVLATYSDRLVISRLLSLEDLAYYTVGYEAVIRLWIIPWSLSISLLPAFVRVVDKRGLYLGSVRNLMLLMVPIILGLILLARPGLDLYLGTGFSENSTLVLQILGIGLLFNCLAFVPYSFFQSVGRPDIPAKVLLTLMPIHLVLVWILTDSLGIVGTSLAWAWWAGLGGIILWLLGRKYAVRIS